MWRRHLAHVGSTILVHIPERATPGRRNNIVAPTIIRTLREFLVARCDRVDVTCEGRACVTRGATLDGEGLANMRVILAYKALN